MEFLQSMADSYQQCSDLINRYILLSQIKERAEVKNRTSVIEWIDGRLCQISKEFEAVNAKLKV